MGRTKYLTNRAKYLFEMAKLNLGCTAKIGLTKILERGALVLPGPREDLAEIAERSRSLRLDLRIYRNFHSDRLREEYPTGPL